MMAKSGQQGDPGKSADLDAVHGELNGMTVGASTSIGPTTLRSALCGSLHGSATLVNVNDVSGHAAVFALPDEAVAAITASGA